MLSETRKEMSKGTDTQMFRTIAWKGATAKQFIGFNHHRRAVDWLQSGPEREKQDPAVSRIAA